MTAVAGRARRTASRVASFAAPATVMGMLGSGLVVLAIAAGVGTWAVAPLAAAGGAQVVVATLALADRSHRWPLAVTVTAVAPSACWVALAAIDGASLAGIPLLPMLAATALALPAVAHPRLAAGARQRPAAALAGIVAAAVIVGLVATPALAATPAGGLAVPHGDHGIVDDHSGH